MPPQIGLKQFRIGADSRSSVCLSYCFYDPITGHALLIDSHRELLDDYTAYLAEKSLKLMGVIDTQTHWCHLSASQLLRARYGCSVAKRGETITIGKLSLHALLTPGVTEDAQILFNNEIAFTGNTLWIGSCAPQGLGGSDAKKHWNSLQKVLTTLSAQKNEKLLILPAFSTLAVEKKKNRALKHTSAADFLLWSNERAVFPDSSFKEIAKENQDPSESPQTLSRLESVFKGSGVIDDFDAISASVGAIAAEKYSHKIEKHVTKNAFLDVRENAEFSEGHIPGTTNWPLVEVGLHLDELTSKERIYVSCLSGRRSDWVSRTLAYLDFSDVVNVSGGFKAWQHAGLPVEIS
jgi:rhodanese-related sulfurtransferase/glyoxylase-like metal-dependent hydrolase (beta-lactamase superfamily II)